MSKREKELLIEDILESIEKIQKYTKGLSFSDFEIDDKTIDAVIRNFGIIGEAQTRSLQTLNKKILKLTGHK